MNRFPLLKPLVISFIRTTILQGRGLGLVERTAKETKFGKIATLLETTEDESSPLKKKVDLIVKHLFLIALGMSLIFSYFFPLP